MSRPNPLQPTYTYNEWLNKLSKCKCHEENEYIKGYRDGYANYTEMKNEVDNYKFIGAILFILLLTVSLSAICIIDALSSKLNELNTTIFTLIHQ